MKYRMLFVVFVMVGIGIFIFRSELFPPEGIRRFSKWNQPSPTPQQLAWQELKLGMFFHFGMTTFSGVVGMVTDASMFDPEELDVNQWMAAVKSVGAKYAVLTAQHADGFLLWNTDLYDYGVRQSPWRNGEGDLVKEFVEACRRNGIKPGIYLNVADNAYWGVKYPGVVKEGVNSPEQQRYNRMVEKMVAEICSRYGKLVELWFDGGVLFPDEAGPEIASIIRRLQPDAMVMKGQNASTIRLSGGETGLVAAPCYYTARRYYSMGSGHPAGKYYLPVECNSPIKREQWFWRPNTDGNLFTLDDLMKMYKGSVGNNGNLLLNANPDNRGLIPEKDMELYKAFGKWSG